MYNLVRDMPIFIKSVDNYGNIYWVRVDKISLFIENEKNRHVTAHLSPDDYYNIDYEYFQKIKTNLGIY